MILSIIAATLLFLIVSFIYWRTPWARSLPSSSLSELWRQNDLKLGRPLPSAILDAVFEGCKIEPQADKFYFEINGSKPIEISLADSSSHWSKSYNVPEMLAMYGLQYAACCLKMYEQSRDLRWLDKYDRALEIAESEAYRGLTKTLYPWTEHAVALRMVSSRYCLNVIARHTDNQVTRARYQKVLGIHLTSARLCAQPLLYDFITNHGLITDNALIQCAITWPQDFSLYKKITQIVSKRVEEAMVYFVSPDGVPLEPATSYWYLIRRLLNEIREALQNCDIKLSEQFNTRLASLDAFLAATNMNGLTQRFGDSACGHHINLPFKPDVKTDGAFLKIYDTGLILLNVVQGGKVVVQLLINGQDIHPRVHAQDDAGAIAFFARNTFWFNSPGSYTAMNLNKRKVYTHYSNQSTAWSSINHTNSCKISAVDCTMNHIEITLILGGEIIRRISFSRKGIHFKITDSAPPKNQLSTGILLAPDCLIKKENDGFILQSQGHELLIKTLETVTENIGYISYRRNEVLATKSIRRSGESVTTEINLPEFKDIILNFNSRGKPQEKYVRARKKFYSLAECIRTVSIKKLWVSLAFSIMFMVYAVCLNLK